MEMKKVIITALVALLTHQAEVKAEVWTLDQCINYALEHNLDVKSALVEQYGSSQSVVEAKDRFLPSLNAGASQSWNYGRGLTSDNTYANRNTASLGWNASLQLPLFQGLSAVRQLAQARASERSSELRVAQARDEVKLSVISYYYQALYCKEMIEVRREELRLTQVQLERQEVLLEGGKIAEVEVLQARSQVASAKMSLATAESDYSMALLDLSRALQLGPAENLEVANEMPAQLPDIPGLEEVCSNALANNSGVLASRSNVEVADKAISLARSGYLPRLSLNAGLGSNYYTMSGYVSDPFSRQMRNNLSKTLGFSLSIPIFDAFSTRNQVRRARLQRLTAQLEVERRESEMLRAIRRAHTEAESARARYDATVVAVEASKAALEAMTDKYDFGRANATEWEQTRSNYTTNLAQQVGLTYQLLLQIHTLEIYNSTNR